jgi:hypothetical protein
MAKPKDEEFRRNADDAQAWADRAKTDDERAQWLRVMQGWLDLIRKPAKAETERPQERGSGSAT